MFRWGVLSTAKIGREHVIPGIIASSNGILAGIASRELAKAENLATTRPIEGMRMSLGGDIRRMAYML